MERVRYRVTLPEELAVDLSQQVERFLALSSSPLRREKRGKVIEFDLRHELHELTAHERTLEMVVGRGKPAEYASAILGLPLEALKEARLEKLEVLFAEPEASAAKL
jgi:hypothetical protein